jgi:hypothetical protein
MNTVELTRGASVIVDADDLTKITMTSWNLNSMGYAVRFKMLPSGKRTHELMHRFIMGLEYGDRRVVDHINGDKLDNRKENLRICSIAENCLNSKAHRDNKSGFKGAFLHKPSGRWMAQIARDGKKKHLGYFSSAEEAHAAYCAAAKVLHGDFYRETTPSPSAIQSE